jgi:hypothetical protein
MSPALLFTLTLDHCACLSTAIPFITHLHMIIMDAHSKYDDVFIGGRCRDLARPQVKTCAMSRALDFKAFYFSLGQGSTVMGADVLNGIIVTTDVEYGHFGATHVNQADAAFRQVGYRININSVGHKKYLALFMQGPVCRRVNQTSPASGAQPRSYAFYPMVAPTPVPRTPH